MTRRLDTLRRPARSITTLDALSQFKFGASTYPLFGSTTWGYEAAETVEASFLSYVQNVYRANGPVFSTIYARMRLFTEVEFAFQSRRTRETFTSSALGPLEQPWPNGTTGDLLARMEQDASLAGNFYAAIRFIDGRPRIHRMRPDWVDVVVNAPSGDPNDLDAEPYGYLYHPGGEGKAKPVRLLPEQVCHFAPIPDPDHRYRGMSWLAPVLEEVRADGMATRHKRKFFENAATPNLAVSLSDKIDPQAFKQFVDAMDANHGGVENAYKTLYTAGGADVTVIGADLKQLDFTATQGGGETRIASAGGVPPIIAGFKEGLDSATYSNYGQARRAFGDLWARPQWRMAADSLARIIDVPGGARLWYDASRISFLQEDEKDTAEIQHQNASTLASLVMAGYTPESAQAAVIADNFGLLEHSGLYSVQLHPPGTNPPAPGQTATPDLVAP
jgi:phage portal protein BeeE